MNVRERIGKYELIKPLGQGATSVVYESYHPELNRVVALKLLNRDRIFDEQSLARFRAEGEKLATLRHPHIVTIYDANYQDGRPYIVTELLEGHDLDSYISRFKSFSLEDILEIAVQLADALAATHANNIVHRDVKLSNIMVTRKQGKIHITLMDYGIARNDHTYTEEGHFIGTHAYASPEQLCCERVDHRSDIYSMGVVLYVLLSNMLPSNSLFQIKNAIPVKIGDIAQVPSYIARIVDKCLEKQPKDRFQSTLALKNALLKARQRYLSPRFAWLRQAANWLTLPLKQALVNSGIAMLLLLCSYPWLANLYNRHQLSLYTQSLATEAGIVAAYLEEALAFDPDKLSVMLQATIYRQQYDKFVLLDKNGSIQAASDSSLKLASHYQSPGRALKLTDNASETLYFPQPHSTWHALLPWLADWMLPSLDDLLEVDHAIQINDKTIGHVVMKKHGVSGTQVDLNRSYLILAMTVMLLVFILTYRSSRKLNRYLEYTKENLQRSMTGYSLRSSKPGVKAWSDENAAIPFDWEQFVAASAVAGAAAPVKKASDIMPHTAREQLKLAAHFDALARHSDE